jgi:hypothetical protein
MYKCSGSASDPFVRGTDPRIRIRIRANMSRIRNTAVLSLLCFFLPVPSHTQYAVLYIKRSCIVCKEDYPFLVFTQLLANTGKSLYLPQREKNGSCEWEPMIVSDTCTLKPFNLLNLSSLILVLCYLSTSDTCQPLILVKLWYLSISEWWGCVMKSGSPIVKMRSTCS